jgi:hypothetical protein
LVEIRAICTAQKTKSFEWLLFVSLVLGYLSSANWTGWLYKSYYFIGGLKSAIWRLFYWWFKIMDLSPIQKECLINFNC